MDQQKQLELNNGSRMPIIGLGTALGNDQGRRKENKTESNVWCGVFSLESPNKKLTEEIERSNTFRYEQLSAGNCIIRDRQIGEDDTVVDAVVAALETGYRHIDTAYVYQNESAVGEGIKKWLASNPGHSREDIFVTTKLPMMGMRADLVDKCLKLSLERLKLDYVDLYLVHCPMGIRYKDENTLVPVTEDGLADIDTETDLEAVWRAMEKQPEAGRAKAIGLSNFNEEQVERICKLARVKPAILQVELHVYMQQKELRDVCDKHGIIVTAYAPLGSPGIIDLFAKLGDKDSMVPDILEDSTVVSIAKKHGKTPAQVLLRHLIQNGIIVIPKTKSSDRIKENFQIFDFELSDAEVKKMNKLDKGSEARIFHFKNLFKGCEKHPEYPF